MEVQKEVTSFPERLAFDKILFTMEWKLDPKTWRWTSGQCYRCKDDSALFDHHIGSQHDSLMFL